MNPEEFDRDSLLGLSEYEAVRRIEGAGLNARIASRDGVALDLRIPGVGSICIDVERDRVLRVR